MIGFACSLKILKVFLGNMGYPVITRLGLNQFWYRHWCANSNKNYFQNFKQDIIFTRLFKMYIYYGFTFPTPLFFHEFFYSKHSKAIRKYIVTKNLKYYRRFYFSNYNLGIEHSYFLRYKTGEFFPLRLWVIKYSNWILLCFNCFKPIKKKFKGKNIMKAEFYALTPNLKYNLHSLKYKRFKLIFLFLKKFFFSKSLNYMF